MAGSLCHLVDRDGSLQLDLIENLGDAGEALTECFYIIKALSGGKRSVLNPILSSLKYPTIHRDMIGPEDKCPACGQLKREEGR